MLYLLITGSSDHIDHTGKKVENHTTCQGELLRRYKVPAVSGFTSCKISRTLSFTFPPQHDQRRVKCIVMLMLWFYTVQCKYQSITGNSWSEPATFYLVIQHSPVMALYSFYFLTSVHWLQGEHRLGHVAMFSFCTYGFFCFFFCIWFVLAELQTLWIPRAHRAYLVAMLLLLVRWKPEPNYRITPWLI